MYDPHSRTVRSVSTNDGFNSDGGITVQDICRWLAEWCVEQHCCYRSYVR